MESLTAENATMAETLSIEAVKQYISSSTAISSVILLVVSYIGVQSFRSWYRLRHIPGPFLAQFSLIWLVWRSWRGNLWEDIGHVSEKYGPIIRIGPNEIAVGDPESLRKMWAARTKWSRSNWYTGARFDPNMDNLLSVVDGDVHTQLRAKMAAGYAGKENISVESDIDGILAKLIDLINRKYISEGTDYKPLDFGILASYFTLDAITKVAYGEEFGYLDRDEDVYGWIATLAAILPFMIMLTLMPILGKILNLRILQGFKPHEKDTTGLGRAMGVAKEVVRKRLGPDKEVHQDMLGSFLRHGLSKEQAASEILLQILAGSDTTATGIRATFLYILTSPTTHAKLLHEIHNAIISQKVSSPITDSEARSLPYLQACIKEGLRIFPPATGLVMKNPPPGGDTLCGIFIPEGTRVGYCAWPIFRSKEVFGADADFFRPERWLEAKDEVLDRMEKNMEILFAPGKWSCLGRNMALLELNKVFFELLRNFDFAIVDPTRPWKSYNAAIFLQSRMFVRVSKRNWDDIS